MKTTHPLFLFDSLGKPGTGWCSAAAEGLCWGESWWHSQEWVCSDFCLGGPASGGSGPKAPPAGHRGEVPLLQYGARPHALDGWSQPADWRTWQPQVNVIFCFISSFTIIIAVIISASSIFESHPLSSFVRDVSSAGLVIANHQDIKSEIETRADSFTACIEMGNTLINNNHYAADEVLADSSISLYLI